MDTDVAISLATKFSVAPAAGTAWLTESAPRLMRVLPSDSNSAIPKPLATEPEFNASSVGLPASALPAKRMLILVGSSGQSAMLILKLVGSAVAPIAVLSAELLAEPMRIV